MSNLSITDSNYNLAINSAPKYQRPSFIDRVEQVATPLLFTSMAGLGAYVATLSSASEGLIVAGLGSSLLCLLGGMTSAIRQKPDAGKWMLGGLLGSTASIVLLNDRANLIQQNHHLADSYNQVRNQLHNLEAEKEPYVSSQCQKLLDGRQEQAVRALYEVRDDCKTALNKTIGDCTNQMKTLQATWQDGCNQVLNQTVSEFRVLLDTSMKTTDQCTEKLNQSYNQTEKLLTYCKERLNISMAQTEAALMSGQKCVAGVQEMTAQIDRISTLAGKQ